MGHSGGEGGWEDVLHGGGSLCTEEVVHAKVGVGFISGLTGVNLSLGELTRTRHAYGEFRGEGTAADYSDVAAFVVQTVRECLKVSGIGGNKENLKGSAT